MNVLSRLSKVEAATTLARTFFMLDSYCGHHESHIHIYEATRTLCNPQMLPAGPTHMRSKTIARPASTRRRRTAPRTSPRRTACPNSTARYAPCALRTTHTAHTLPMFLSCAGQTRFIHLMVPHSGPFIIVSQTLDLIHSRLFENLQR